MGNVKIFRSTDYDAPALYGNAGFLIPVLDACLVNGYGTNNISSLTHDSGTVTATTAIAHMLTTGSRQTIAGANEAGYNGEFIITVTGTYTFTYQAGGISASIATGSITTKSAGAGWTKPFSGTNLAAYRPGAGSRLFLRINDTTTQAARCVGYESMSDIDTGNNPFPSAAQFAGGLYWAKSSTADATNARPWIIIADDKTVYMWVNYNGSSTFTDTPVHCFGDFTSYKAGDAYNSVLIANTAATTVANFRFAYLVVNYTTVATGIYIARPYTQVGSSNAGALISDAAKAAGATTMGAGGLPYPHGPDGSLMMAPVWLVESNASAALSVIRGVLRGIWNPLHTLPLANGDTFTGSGDLAGKSFMGLRVQPSGLCIFDTSLTW